MPEPPLRVCLFTDTLADVNGVARFIRAAAAHCARAGHDLHVITSTRLECPRLPNIHNVTPRYCRPMPGYPTIDAVVPARGAICRVADRLRPDVVHVSTPGPVGLIGRNWALGRGLPLVGTYHTDFPAYVDHLFDDRVLTWMCAHAMRRFYAPFARVLARSRAYADVLHALGIAPERVEPLAPGIDTAAFGPRLRDPTGHIWKAIPGVRPESLKILYVGRVSVEKNLPWLTKVWGIALDRCRQRGIDVQLIIVGDGPYRAEMERSLSSGAAVFAGFRLGDELAVIYATSDLFIFPSLTDTLGQSVMEAQASGLPAIVSDRGGPCSIVEHGVTGLVLPVVPPDAAIRRWADALVGLAGDAEVRRRMGAAGAARVASMSIKRSIEQFWAVHESVAKGTTSGRVRAPGR